MTSDGGFPTFIIIGAAKAGTTSLFRYLGQHPDVFVSPVKEPRFFALEGHPLDFKGPGDEQRLRTTTRTTLEAYRELFAGRRDERVAGEGSVLYLQHPRAAPAIARAIPDVKIVAILRDPVERAHSGFLYHVRDEREPLPTFEEALRAEPERIAQGWYHGWAYRDQGFYHRHLQRYLEHVDRERIHVCLHEDLDRNPHGVLAGVFRFLEVDDTFRADVSIRWNPSGRPRSRRAQRLLTGRNPVKEAVKRVIPERWGQRVIDRVMTVNLERPPVAPETRAELVAGYADDVHRLEELIGRDLTHWQR